MTSKTELFLILATPNSNGVSRWVNVSEFVDEYKSLVFGNGGSWCRGSSTLAKNYLLEVDKSLTSGNSIDAIRTIGTNTQSVFNQYIRKDIVKHYRNEPCVIMGVVGDSENTKIEIDHKEGSKNNERVSNKDTQTLDDFQPLTKAANDVKRQICKNCQSTDCRFDATVLKGFPVSYYKGGKSFKENGCDGCYQYDPVKYREELVDNIKAMLLGET